MGRNFASLVAAGLVAVAPLAANAEYISATACSSGVGTIGTTFTGVESAITTSVFTKTADRDNLLSKLSAAYNKAAVEKYSPDAIAKLQSISDTALALASAAKPKLQNDDAIAAAVLAAQQCITYP